MKNQISKPINNYYEAKKEKISKLTNNHINDMQKSYQIVFDDVYNSRDLVIFESGKKILVGKYEVLGYTYYGKWTWACDNMYIEKYHTNISKKIKNKIKDNLDNLDNLLKASLYYSNMIWIVKRDINFDSNINEYIILTKINMVI